MSSGVWEDLILSILSVNRYSLEKTYSSMDGFRSEGLFDPRKLAERSLEEITVGLRRGGYDRGEYLTKLFAMRLMSLATFVKRIGVEESERVLTSLDKRKIEEFLQPAKGISPQVLSNFFALRQGAQQP